MKKLLIFFISGLAICMSACIKPEQDHTRRAEPPMSPEQVVYVKHCKLCHGAKGDLGLSGAANLKTSVLSIEEVKQVVTNGRNAMPAWGQQLPPNEIELVASYVMTLRGK